MSEICIIRILYSIDVYEESSTKLKSYISGMLNNVTKKNEEGRGLPSSL